LNLNQLYEKFKKGEKPKENLGASKDYNVDIIPKFIMASGLLVQILIKTDVTRYLEFKSVDGSYVAQHGSVYKVPSTSAEAIKSSLMGILEKRRCAKFLEYVGEWEEEDPKTYKGYDVKKMTAAELFKTFGLSSETIEFIGHAMALYYSDEYLSQPVLETIKRVKLYGESVLRYGNSPYIYPLYGLGEMPQGFARLSAIYGGTYMLSKPVEQIVYDDNGRVVGVKSEGEIAKCKYVIGDPSYFPDKVKKVGQVVRCICILSHPVPNTNNAASCQIIIPFKECKRKNDVYVSVVSYEHNVAAKGKYIAIISTTVETANPLTEFKAGLDILGPVDETFVYVSDLFDPVSDGTKDGVYISKSFGADSHFGWECSDILDIYKRIMGKDMSLTKPEGKEETQ
jgi:Rab GDP dissociation inhibitor